MLHYWYSFSARNLQMTSTARAHRMYSVAITLSCVLAAACSPERIPGSTVDQGDAGVSFVRAAANASGSGASSVSSATGSSYGGGSSGSSRSSASSRVLGASGEAGARLGGKGCDWFGSGSAGSSAIAPPGWGKHGGVGYEGWFAANCMATTTGR